MAKRSITTQKVLDACRDEWQPLEGVVAAALPTVPPGKALRHFEAKTKRTTKPEWTEDEKIYSGQRHFAMVAVRTLTNSNQIETRTTPDGEVLVRLTPARPAFVPLDTCPHCLRPYDRPEEVVPPFGTSGTPTVVIYPQQFNRRRFG